MKRLTSAIAIFIAGALAASAAVNVTYKNAQVADGSTITLGKDAFTPLTGIPGYTVKAEIDVAGAAPVNIDVVSTSNDVMFCFTNGNCFPWSEADGKYTSTASFNTATQTIDLHMESYGDAIPTVNSTLDFTVSDKLFDTMSFRVVIDSSADSGVKGVLADDITGVNVRGNRLVYRVQGASPLTVYTLAGNVAMRRTISGSGSIDLSSLPMGMYVYRGAGVTGKVVVR